MSDGRLRYDPRDWHNVQAPEEMDVSRHFEYDDAATCELKKWLRLDSVVPKAIVEVGSGSGYFTEKLLNMADALKELVAVEPDDVLRQYAEKKLGLRVKFVKGTAEKIPLPDETADLSTCHIVLNNLPDVYEAVEEMVRVTRTNGIVSAIEPGQSRMRYLPDPDLNGMEEKAEQAYGRGIWKLRNSLIDYSKDLKAKSARYPEVFHNCGLQSVESHGILSVFLLSDPRRSTKEVHSWLKDCLRLFEQNWNRSKAILIRGGVSEDFTQKYHAARTSYLKSLIEHPEKIAETHELQTYSRTVTVGFKRSNPTLQH